MKLYTAKTLEECLATASEELETPVEDIIYTVVEEKKGIFSKKVTISVEEISDVIEFTENYIKDVEIIKETKLVVGDYAIEYISGATEKTVSIRISKIITEPIKYLLDSMKDIEKGVFITTGTFTKAAREEASNAGKQQIDLIDGEEFINKLIEYRLGVREKVVYEVDKSFFEKV